MVTVKVRKIDKKARLPEYAHPGDAGLDLFAVEETTIYPGESELIPTGIQLELPPGTEAQIRPKSGLALKHKITVLNTPGTIDEGYRGEVAVILINHGKQPFRIHTGMKIAQMIVQQVLRVTVEEAVGLTDSHRGDGGFGSTGK